MDIALRPTTPEDLDFVIALERDDENRPFIGQWSREEHLAAIDRADREHWIVADGAGARLGYVILYDVRSMGQGVYVKRIAIGPKSAGVGRRALAQLVEHACRDLGAEFVTLGVIPHNHRAQKAYRAVGFEVMTLTEPELRRMQADVDPFPDDCLVMKIGRGSGVPGTGVFSTDLGKTGTGVGPDPPP